MKHQRALSLTSSIWVGLNRNLSLVAENIVFQSVLTVRLSMQSVCVQKDGVSVRR